MGIYLNPGNDSFRKTAKSAYYIDKSALIALTNELVDTDDCFVCISRPRRFGKTKAMEMLAAYYSRGADSGKLFEGLAIEKHPTYEEHLNQYDCLMFNMLDFYTKSASIEAMIDLVRLKIIKELKKAYPDIVFSDMDDFVEMLEEVYEETKRPFIVLIDEWDCIFREHQHDLEVQKKYLSFLRLWLKGKRYVGLAYMTGILPVKKYGSGSSLNMFKEFSMTNPRQFAPHFGFTTEEVKACCEKFGVSFDEMKSWYNGYFIEWGIPVYNPNSVRQSLESGVFDTYWSRTEYVEPLKDYIRLGFDDLREKITEMLGGNSISVNPDKFANDMTTFNSSDDVFALLIHLGYLSYDFEKRTVRIPNNEIRIEFRNAIEDLSWDGVALAIQNAEKLLQSIWEKESDKVASSLEVIHEKNTSVLNYNDENALSYVVNLALFTAFQYYTMIRELPSGKGFADLVFIPRLKHADKPAMIVELKWDKSAKGAIDQIKAKNYVSALEDYKGNLLLVGINYDKGTKHHECVIEEYDFCG